MLNPIRHLPSEITRTNRRYLNFPMENRVEFRASKFRDTSKAKEQEGTGYRKIPDLFIHIYIYIYGVDPWWHPGKYGVGIVKIQRNRNYTELLRGCTRALYSLCTGN